MWCIPRITQHSWLTCRRFKPFTWHVCYARFQKCALLNWVLGAEKDSLLRGTNCDALCLVQFKYSAYDQMIRYPMYCCYFFSESVIFYSNLLSCVGSISDDSTDLHLLGCMQTRRYAATPASQPEARLEDLQKGSSVSIGLLMTEPHWNWTFSELWPQTVSMQSVCALLSRMIVFVLRECKLQQSCWKCDCCE